MKRTLPLVALALSACVAGFGCGPASDDPSEGESGSSGGSSGGGTTSGPVATTAADTTGGVTSGATTDVGSSSDGADDVGFVPRPDAGGPSAGLPNGETCRSSDECASESCFVFPGGGGFGLCSDCETDADCMQDGGPGTCSFGNNGWVECTDGSQGNLCMSTEACAEGLMCTEGYPGLLQCGECATADDCDPMQLCLPIGGALCIDPGSVENGEGCSAPDDGACMSGHCTEVLFMNMSVGLFVCSECSIDADCDQGQTCVPADFGPMGPMPATCG